MTTSMTSGDPQLGLKPGETDIPGSLVGRFEAGGDASWDGPGTAGVAGVWDGLWWPRRPYATDRFAEGIYRFPRPVAKGKRYVEANPAGVSNLLVIDIDHPDSALRAVSANGSHPMPNVIVENPGNGHAHAIWALAEPVTRTEYGRRKPLAYATAVTEGLRRAMDGDKGYSGLMTKNPLHQAWTTHLLHTGLHQLGQLEHTLGRHMPPPRWRESRLYDPAGLGRNCCLFDNVRVWAYRTARQIRLRHEHPTPADSHDLHTAITTHIHTRNTEFTEPLPPAETRAITTSIHTWITTHFYGWTNTRTTNSNTFTTIQKKRGTKGGTKGGRKGGRVTGKQRSSARELRYSALAGAAVEAE